MICISKITFFGSTKILYLILFSFQTRRERECPEQAVPASAGGEECAGRTAAGGDGAVRRGRGNAPETDRPQAGDGGDYPRHDPENWRGRGQGDQAGGWKEEVGTTYPGIKSVASLAALKLC